MVQGLQEDMKGLKNQLKERQRSNVDGGSDGGHHSRGRRISRGLLSVHRHGRRGAPSSSPSEADSDRDSQSSRSSSSDFETKGLQGSKRKAKRYRDSRTNALPSPPPLPTMGAVPGGYYPYHLIPPGAYGYMHPPAQSYYNGGPPSHGATEVYPSLYKGTVYGGRGSEVAGRECEGHRSQRHRRCSGSDLSHSKDHRFWDGKARGGFAPGGVERGGAFHNSTGDWSDSGTAAAAATAAVSRSLGMESVVADGKRERRDERGEGATSPRGDGEDHGPETASIRRRKAEKRAARSGSSPGASGPRHSKRRRRHSEGSQYRFPPAGFAFPPLMGASHHPFAFTPPPPGGPGGGYPHVFPYHVPSDPRTIYDGHFPKAPGWGDGHPYAAAAAPSYEDRHGSRRRPARLSVPEDVGDDRRRSTPTTSSVGGGSEVECGRSSSRRSVERKSRSCSPSESESESEM